MSFQEMQQAAQSMLREVEAKQDDNETAHAVENCLHEAVLLWIAEHGDEQSATLAKIALRTNDLDFRRWYA